MATPTALTAFTPVFKPLTNIGAFTFGAGYTFLEMYEELRNYLTTTLAPELNEKLTFIYDETQAQVNALADDVNASKGAWQALFDQFMADVIVELESLNDAAVTNLVNNTTSQLRVALDGLFEPRYRSDTNSKFVSHDKFGITGAGDELVKLTNALNTIPLGSVLTVPDSMTVDLGAGTLVIGRGVGLRGGRLKSTANKVVQITAGNTSLENIKITGTGVTKGYLINQETVSVRGTIDAYIENVLIKNVAIDDIRDSGIYTEFVRELVVENCKVDRYAYAGIAIHSTDNFVVRGCTVENLITIDGLTSRWGYGISVSDLVAMEPFRSRNGVVENNVVKYVRRGAGCETHGGYNIAFLNNRVYGCRNSFTLTTGNATRQFTSERCRIIGNFIDATGWDGAELSNGMSLGGGTVDSPFASDCIVVLNTINNTVRPVSYPPAYRPEPWMNMGQSVVAMNTANNMRVDEMEGTNWTTGWLPATDFGTFKSGYTSNPQIPVQLRISHNDLGYHVELNGVAGLAAPPATGYVFFTITSAKLLPPIKLMLGMSSTVDSSALFQLSIEPNGDILHQFSQQSTVALMDNAVLHGRWSTKLGRWDGGAIN